MPLDVSEMTATFLAALKVHAQKGSTVGVQTYLRGLGAHSEQARRLTMDAETLYDLAYDSGAMTMEEREVSVQVESGDKELDITLKADRLPITSFEELVDFYEIDTDIWKPTSKLFNFWGSKENPNFQVRANFVKDTYQESQTIDREEFRQWAKEFAPEWEESEIEPVGSGGMLELVLSDLHLGKASHLGTVYESQIATACLGIMRGITQKVDKVHLVLLGDTFNSEGKRGTTTKGTPQDEDADWPGVFSSARSLIASISTHLRDNLGAHVNVHVLPGNHDYERSYYLADTLWAYFHNHPDIDVSVSDNPRQYIRWGTKLIGLTHGNDIKPQELAMMFLHETSTVGIAEYEWHLGHYHSRREDEFSGVRFKWFGTPSLPGEWDTTKGFHLNRREVVGILHDKFGREVARFSRAITNG